MAMTASAALVALADDGILKDAVVDVADSAVVAGKAVGAVEAVGAVLAVHFVVGVLAALAAPVPHSFRSAPALAVDPAALSVSAMSVAIVAPALVPNAWHAAALATLTASAALLAELVGAACALLTGNLSAAGTASTDPTVLTKRARRRTEQVQVHCHQAETDLAAD